MHTETLEQAGKAIVTSFMVIVSLYFVLDPKMLQLSWKKASEAVGLAGLTPREMARGALTWLQFQRMLDHLDLDPFGKLIVKGEVSAVFINYFYSVFNVEHVRQILV